MRPAPFLVLAGSFLLLDPVLLGQTAAPPLISPPGGTYAGDTQVRLESATAGAKIHFTLDGTPPTRDSPVYTGEPILVSNHVTGNNRPPSATQAALTNVSTQLRAIAVAEGLGVSTVSAADYVIDKVAATFDIPYIPDGQVKHTLDVYQPAGLKGTPVLFFVHGGAWTQGSKEVYFELGNTFAGYYQLTTVVINYRLSPPGGTAQHPDHINDVAAAFDWTVKNIAKYGGDPERIVIFGQSAGGHLVSLFGTSRAFEQYWGAVRGVVTMSGAYDLFDMTDSLLNPLGLSGADLTAYRVLFNLVFGSGKKETLDAASPQVLSSTSQPPFFVIGLQESEGFVDMPGFMKESENFLNHVSSLHDAPRVDSWWLLKEDIPEDVLAIDIPDFSYDGHYHEIYAINTRNWDSVSSRIVADYVLGTVCPGQVIPVVISAPGKSGSLYSSELTLANRGPAKATAKLTYSSSTSGGVTGALARVLEPGQQIVVPDIIEALASEGVPVKVGSEIGTVRVTWEGASVFAGTPVLARTVTPAGSGLAGVAYAGVNRPGLSTSRAFIFGLRETTQDRSNLGLVNAGQEGTVILRVTLFPGDSGGRSVVLTPDTEIGPGEWRQLSGVLGRAGFSRGYALVERVSGTEPFVAYGVINDNGTGDGSYVSMVPATGSTSQQMLPVVVEMPGYESDAVLANPGPVPAVVSMTYTEALDEATFGSQSRARVTLGSGEQILLPRFLEFVRENGASIPARGGAYAGPVAIQFEDAAGAPLNGFAHARTSAPDGTGGFYGVAYPAVPQKLQAKTEAWIHGLAQNVSVRSNLAVANASEEPISLQFDVFSGESGQMVKRLDPVQLGPFQWKQFNRFLDAYSLSSGFVRVTRVAGGGAFIAYGVAVDNGTNDGSYLEMTGVK